MLYGLKGLGRESKLLHRVDKIVVHVDEDARPKLDRFQRIVEGIDGGRAAADVCVPFEDGDLDIRAMLSVVGDVVCRR